MTVTADRAEALMNEMATVRCAAAAAEMRAAAYLLAATIRQEHPTSARVHLEPSEHGEDLWPTAWSDATGQSHDLDPDDEICDAAEHLLHEHIGIDPDHGTVPGLWRERKTERYLLDVDRALTGYEVPVVAEVLTVRDPDGPTEVHITVLGTLPKVAYVAEYSVDAGAGFEWEDWASHRDESLAAASDAIRPSLLAALAAPPGGKYVMGRPEGVGWLDGLSSDQDGAS